MHTVGGNKLFCFSFNEHILSKVELYTIFRCTFFLFLTIYSIKQHCSLLLGGQFLLEGFSNLIDERYSSVGLWVVVMVHLLLKQYQWDRRSYSFSIVVQDPLCRFLMVLNQCAPVAGY